jgi:hypothetical protein
MRINYNLLWIEDEQSWYDTTLELFTQNLEDHGFNLIPTKCKNFDEIEDLIKLDGLKKYDLLLIDFTLRASKSGDEIIQLIRSSSIYTDIIFYSSAVETVRKSMRDHELEGVYSSDRKDIENKFNQVFETTIKKIQEINSMRGLIVGETSELDVIIEDLALDVLINKLKVESEELDKIMEEYCKNLRSRPDKFLEGYVEHGFKFWFHRLEAMAKWQILRTYLKKIPKDQAITEFLKINAKYSDHVIDIRNKFAHSKSIEKSGISVLIAQMGKDDFEYNEDKFIEIRKNLKEHRDSFENLINILNK